MYKAVMIHPQVALIKPVLSVFAPTESYTKIKKIPCNFNVSADLQGFIVFLHIEQEVHHISVLYDIILAFGADKPFFLSDRQLPAAFHQFIVSDGLRTDEALLEVGMDLAGGSRSFCAILDGPRPYFRFACRQEGY